MVPKSIGFDNLKGFAGIPGYAGGLMKKLHQNIEIPKKNTKLNPLSKEDRLKNRNISLKRIPVEHINAKIKTFKILSQRYRNRRKRFGYRLNLFVL